MRQKKLLLVLAVLSAVGGAPALPAQSADTAVRIRLESGDGSPVAGALVGLLDSEGRVVAEGVSSADGKRVLRATPASYRVWVRRIGFLPFISDPVSLPQANDLAVRVESRRVHLQTVVVRSKSGCGPIDPADRTLALVWDEIAKALRTSQLSAADLAGIAQVFVYRKHLSPSGVVGSSDTVFLSVVDQKPIGVRDPASLSRYGYVRGNERVGWTYYAPDETVLLSDQFAATHCFRVVRDARRSKEVGIEFTPVKGRSLPDIAGILWVDEGTAELRELRFRYVNAGLLDRFEAGGFTKFRRVPSGTWIVNDWALRGPIIRLMGGGFGAAIVDGYIEDGGGMVIFPSHAN
jgi:hypothetical protein